MLIKLKPHNTIAELHLRRAGARLISKENFTGGTPTAGMSLIQQGRYSYFYTNTRGDISSSLKHNANSLHSYMYDEYGMLYDNNPNQGGKITLGNMDASNFIQSHNDYTFQQKEYDSESALNYFGARYLDSFSGTWTTNDIVRGNLVEPMSQHRTTYVHDNPVNLIDRYGYSAVGTNSTSEINNIKKGVQNFVMQPKTQNQGNTAGTIFDQFKLFNNNDQGSVISPYSPNKNFGTLSASQKQENQKQTKLQQIAKTFFGPVAERDHRLFMMLDLFGKDYTNLAQGVYGFFNPDISKEQIAEWMEKYLNKSLPQLPEVVEEVVENNLEINIKKSPVDDNFIISSPLGPRNCQGCSTIHGGTDYAVPIGTQVYATAPGVVIRSNSSKTFGNMIIISHGDSVIENQKVYTLYAHGSTIISKLGDNINSGDLIMYSGNTGIGSDGKPYKPHLHHEVISSPYSINSKEFYSENKMDYRYDPDSLLKLIKR